MENVGSLSHAYLPDSLLSIQKPLSLHHHQHHQKNHYVLRSVELIVVDAGFPKFCSCFKVFCYWQQSGYLLERTDSLSSFSGKCLPKYPCLNSHGLSYHFFQVKMVLHEKKNCLVQLRTQRNTQVLFLKAVCTGSVLCVPPILSHNSKKTYSQGSRFNKMNNFYSLIQVLLA